VLLYAQKPFDEVRFGKASRSTRPACPETPPHHPPLQVNTLPAASANEEGIAFHPENIRLAAPRQRASDADLPASLRSLWRTQMSSESKTFFFIDRPVQQVV